MGVKVPGPDPSDDLHAESRGSLKRFLGWVNEIDWAKQLTDALNAPQAIMAATKTVPGILRLATTPEAVAGTLDTAAVTPLGLLSASNVRRFTSFSALHAAAGTLGDGQLAVLLTQTTTNGSVAGSVWRSDGTGWQPALPLRVSSAAVLADLKALPGSYSSISYLVGETRALVPVSGPAIEEYMWVGSTTGFFIWRGALPVSWGTNYKDYATTTLTVNGSEASLNFGTQRSDSGSVTAYQTLLTTDSAGKPINERVFGGGLNSSQSGWGLANFAIQNTGAVLMLAITGTSPYNTAEGAVHYRRQVPTS